MPHKITGYSIAEVLPNNPKYQHDTRISNKILQKQSATKTTMKTNTDQKAYVKPSASRWLGKVLSRAKKEMWHSILWYPTSNHKYWWQQSNCSSWGLHYHLAHYIFQEHFPAHFSRISNNYQKQIHHFLIQTRTYDHSLWLQTTLYKLLKRWEERSSRWKAIINVWIQPLCRINDRMG